MKLLMAGLLNRRNLASEILLLKIQGGDVLGHAGPENADFPDDQVGPAGPAATLVTLSPRGGRLHRLA